MFTRTLTIQANPPQQIVLYFDSKSNAEKLPGGDNLFQSFIDDYGHSAVVKSDAVLCDVISDLSEFNRAHGEIEIVNMRSQLKFDERIEKDAPIKAFVNKKRAEQRMQRMVMPQGGQG